MSNEKHYPLHPNQSHPPIMTCEIPLEEFANPLEVALAFPNVKAIDNFIETLKIYRQKVFFPNVRTRHG